MKTVILDVRSEQEYNEGHLPNAICVPYYDLKNKIEDKVSKKETLIIAYCNFGSRSKKAVEILRKMGYKNSYSIKEGIF